MSASITKSCATTRHSAVPRVCLHHTATFTADFRCSLPCISSTRKNVVVALAGKAKGFGTAPAKPAAAVVAKEIPDDVECPCGSKKKYKDCCSPFHKGTALPATTEQLLRARYTAYYAKNCEFVADTTHSSSKEYTGSRASYLKAVQSTARKQILHQLTVLKVVPGQTADEGTITFKFTHSRADKKDTSQKIRTETSKFIRENGKWFFVDSEFQDEVKALNGWNLNLGF